MLLTNEQIEKLVSKRLIDFPNATQLSLGLIHQGNAYFQGWKNNQQSIDQVNNHNFLAPVDSLSKLMTATILAKLSIEKSFDLKSHINPYFNFELNSKVQLDFLSLTNHTSGLPEFPKNLNFNENDQTNPFEGYESNNLEFHLKEEVSLIEEQIGQFHYSNLGPSIVGLTLSKMTGCSFEELLERYVFTPYKMTNSSARFQSNIKNRFYGQDEHGLACQDWDIGAFLPSGGVVSNVEDMLKFLSHQFDTTDQAIMLTQELTVERDERIQLALGWAVRLRESGSRFYFHPGGSKGYHSIIAMDKQSETGIVILSNLSAFHKNASELDEIAFEILEIVKENQS